MKCLWFLIVLSVPIYASAQPQPDESARRDLIAEATRARDTGDNERALQAAQRAAAMRSSPSLRLLIAEIEVSLGRVLPALADGRLCVRELQADTSYRDWQRYMDSCVALVRANEARVGRVVLRVLDVPGAQVRVNGEGVPEEELGTTREMLVGRILIDASARGRRPYHREITLIAGRTETVDVQLVPLAERPNESLANEPRVAPGGTPRVREGSSSRGAGAGPWVVVGLGAASLAAAGVFFALRQGALADRNSVCGNENDGDCPVTTSAAVVRANAFQDDAHTFNTMTNVAIGVGGAALAGGLVWWLLGRNSQSEGGTVSATLAPREDGATFGVRGTM